MKKYDFVLRKTQDAIIEMECDIDMTLGEVTEKIEQMSEGELEFGKPEFQLIALCKRTGKVSKIILL